MRCRIGLFFLLPSLLTLAGCDHAGPADEPAAPGTAHRPGAYFDVRGLLDRQVQQLTATRAGVRKQASLRDGTTETTTLAQPKWADELQLFYQADINKAAWRGAFAVAEATDATGQRDSYTRSAGFHEVPVRRLQVERTAGGQCRALLADVQQQNLLFFSHKRFALTFGPGGQLSGYDVQGQQKLLFFDTLRYHVAARVQ